MDHLEIQSVMLSIGDGAQAVQVHAQNLQGSDPLRLFEPKGILFGTASVTAFPLGPVGASMRPPHRFGMNRNGSGEGGEAFVNAPVMFGRMP